MIISKQEWELEQKRVDQIVQEISDRLQKNQKQLNQTQQEIVNIRKHFWDNVKVNFEDVTEAAETAASMKQQSEILTERERRHRLAEKETDVLLRLKDSPYFGRIDLREEGDLKAEKIYIGIASLMDKEEEDFLIYDWRAPIASLFYDYSPGKVAYQTPMGTIEGEMKRKRQFVIHRGKIESLFDTNTMIGDELLKQVLGRHSDTQMKSIVATIQHEQNRLIRNESSRLLIVQGAAGSGKTSAALQRIAYLLYRYRETLQAKQILLFSPNAMFNSYISTVLPELSEENMEQTTFQQYLVQGIGSAYTVEDSFSQMEYLLTHKEDPSYPIRMKNILFKSSLVFLQWIDRYVEWLGQQGLIFQDLFFQQKRLFSKEELQAKFYAEPSQRSIPSRLEWLVEWIHEQAQERVKKMMNEPWVKEEVESLPNEVYTQIHQRLQKQRRYSDNTFDDFDREYEMLAQYVIHKKMKKFRRRVNRLDFVDVRSLYAQLFAQRSEIDQLLPMQSLPQKWTELVIHTKQALQQNHLYYEDATPYLYLKERLLGGQVDKSIRYLFIDEAQDYSPFQLVVLHKWFPRSKMTILGDWNQAIYAHSLHQENNFTILQDILEGEKTETIHFTRTYRSTQPIMEFAKQLLMPEGDFIPFQRAGELPRFTYIKDEQEREQSILQRIREWQQKEHRNIAVICKTAEESLHTARRLEKHMDVHLVRKETHSFEPGVTVLPTYLAKGIEFDAVILFDASCHTYFDESERKLFYIACTRAMHELQLYSLGSATPFVERVRDDAWIVEGEAIQTR